MSVLNREGIPALRVTRSSLAARFVPVGNVHVYVRRQPQVQRRARQISEKQGYKACQVTRKRAGDQVGVQGRHDLEVRLTSRGRPKGRKLRRIWTLGRSARPRNGEKPLFDLAKRGLVLVEFVSLA